MVVVTVSSYLLIDNDPLLNHKPNQVGIVVSW